MNLYQPTLGKSLHHAQLLRLKPACTIADLTAGQGGPNSAFAGACDHMAVAWSAGSYLRYTEAIIVIVVITIIIVVVHIMMIMIMMNHHHHHFKYGYVDRDHDYLKAAELVEDTHHAGIALVLLHGPRVCTHDVQRRLNGRVVGILLEVLILMEAHNGLQGA